MQSCFIRKNTPELRNKLEELGYHICPCAEFKDSIWLCTSFITNSSTVHGIGYSTEDLTIRKTTQDDLDFFLYENSKSQNPSIDCGDNEEMFLALAALRDDTDKNQWVIDEANECFGLEDSMMICDRDDMNDRAVYTHYRKATVEEIIEHFK